MANINPATVKASTFNVLFRACGVAGVLIRLNVLRITYSFSFILEP